MTTIEEEYKDKQVVFSRDETGLVKAGDLTCQVPANRTALGVLASNKAFDGDVFADDYWVYNHGQKIRKWFVTTESTGRLWPPNLNNTKRLEELYQKLANRNSSLWGQRINPILEKIFKAGGRAHAKPTHDHTGSQDMWWLFKVRHYEDHLSFSFDWVDSPPEKKINHKLGQALYEAERYWYSLGRRLGIARSALDQSIQLRIQARIKQAKLDPKDYYFHVEINSRSYWYVMGQNHFGWNELKCIVWPQDKAEHILIGDK